jgi:mercuric ion transport protein
MHYEGHEHQSTPGMGRPGMKDRLLLTGVVGTIVTALCCFTPILVWLLAGIGASAAIAYLDMVLLPALTVFIAITGYALWRRRTAQ